MSLISTSQVLEDITTNKFPSNHCARRTYSLESDIPDEFKLGVKTSRAREKLSGLSVLALSRFQLSLLLLFLHSPLKHFITVRHAIVNGSRENTRETKDLRQLELCLACRQHCLLSRRIWFFRRVRNTMPEGFLAIGEFQKVLVTVCATWARRIVLVWEIGIRHDLQIPTLEDEVPDR